MGAGAAKVNNNTTADFLQRCPISILNWNEELTVQFSNCFKNVQVKPGKEVSLGIGCGGGEVFYIY